MSRAVILPTPCNPFLLTYWLDMYLKNVADEVDTLYVHANANVRQDVYDYIREMFNIPNVVFMFTDHQIEHGIAIDKILDRVKEDYVMLIEDDCYTFKPGLVNKMFVLLENNQVDVVGSKRGSCGQEILDASKAKYDLDYSGFGDSGCNFWPAYFFIKTDDLRATDRHFHAKEWRAGTYISELDYTVKENQYGDTFVNTSIQIMAKFPQDRIKYIQQYHASPADDILSIRKQGLFDGKAKHTHIGSLSSFNARRDITPPVMNNQMEKKEWERRIAFWLKGWEVSQPVNNAMVGYSNLYKQKLDELIETMGLSISRVRQFQNIYKKLGL